MAAARSGFGVWRVGIRALGERAAEGGGKRRTNVSQENHTQLLTCAHVVATKSLERGFQQRAHLLIRSNTATRLHISPGIRRRNNTLADLQKRKELPSMATSISRA